MTVRQLLPLTNSTRSAIETFRPSNAPSIYGNADTDPPYNAQSIDEVTRDHIKQALDHLPSDEYELWVRFAHALKPLGAFGKDEWLRWSAKSPKFDRRIAQRTWNSIRSSRIGYKVIFAVAFREGWKLMSTTSTNELPPCVDLQTLARRPPPPFRFIIDSWLPCGYVTLLAGHGGVGKSGISLFLAVCIALGLRFFGMQTEKRRVLYVSCEDRENILYWRLKHICDYLSIIFDDLVGHLEIVDLVGHDSVLYERDPRTGITRTATYSHLSKRVTDLNTELLIVDGISDVYGGNENSKTEVKQFVNSLLALIPADTGAVLLIGHVAKPAAASPNTSEGYSGTTGWHNAPRARWYLRPETEPADDDSPGRLIRTGELVLELQKSNYGASDQSMRFRWDDNAQLFLGKVATSQGPAQNAAQETQEKQAILAAGHDLTSKQINVPAAQSGSNTAYHVLSANSLFPKSLKRGKQNRKRFWRLVREMINDQKIEKEIYQGTGRHQHTRLVFR